MELLEKGLAAEKGAKVALPIRHEGSDGLIFTEVDGVTVIIGVQGGYKIPAVRSYPTGVQSAIHARSLWDTQYRWDLDNQLDARNRRTGHLSPIINKELKCGDKHCLCIDENAARLRSRSLG
jgi:hypothetical protein